MTKSMKYRDGDTMISVDVLTEPAVIKFDDILNAAELKPDNYASSPWEGSDGYEHRVVDDNTDGLSAGSFRQRGMKRIIVEKDQWGNYKYHREHGASRQVAYELTRLTEKDATEQLAKWYDEGWEAWGVVCEYKGEESSCWGFYGDDDSDYIKDALRDAAIGVAHLLEKQGYTVEGIPDRKADYIANRRWHHRYMLHSQDCAHKVDYIKAELKAPSKPLPLP